MDEEFDYSDLSEEEREAAIQSEVWLDELSQAFVDAMVDKLIIFCNTMSGRPLRPYQEPFARRIFESVVIGDAETLTALFARQSGKTETVADTVVTCMLLLPILARVYPDLLGKFEHGVLVGAFAPVDKQANTLFQRIIDRLDSERAKKILADPELNLKIVAKGITWKLSNGSLVCKNTAHPQAKIEGDTYHIILIDEAQGADALVVEKSILPMATETAGTTVMIGTPTYTKGIFFHTIADNKRMATRRGRKRINHFEADWKEVSKYSANYKKTVQKRMLRQGEDSDAFRLAYRLHWLLDKGMFTTSARLSELGDVSMQALVKDWHRTPIVVGIDLGRKQDRTVVTAVFVDWDHPDQAGLYNHRVLSWLDLEGVEWEQQYYQVQNFLERYKVFKVGVDTNGLGDVFIDRMRRMMPHLEFVDLGAGPADQSKRWKYLRELLERRRIAWPAGAKVRALKVWRRFYTEMEDLEVEFKGPNMMGKAPDATDAHDDYPDSLSMACVLTMHEDADSGVEQTQNMFYGRNPRGYNGLRR